MTVFLFDFDSTLVDLESLDFAARCALKDAPDGEARAAEIDALTLAAMEGRMEYGESLSRRVAMAGLTRTIAESGAASITARLDPALQALVDELREAGARVHVVSGGLRPLIGGAAVKLGVARDDLYCNDPVWRGEAIVGVDRDNPLAAAHGKAAVARAVRKRHGAAARIVMIGDGATDLEARAPDAADIMIGYGGVAVRDVVREGADYFAADAGALRDYTLAQLRR